MSSIVTWFSQILILPFSSRKRTRSSFVSSFSEIFTGTESVVLKTKRGLIVTSPVSSLTDLSSLIAICPETVPSFTSALSIFSTALLSEASMSARNL